MPYVMKSNTGKNKSPRVSAACGVEARNINVRENKKTIMETIADSTGDVIQDKTTKPKFSQFKDFGFVAMPTPTSAPMMLCVVETG